MSSADIQAAAARIAGDVGREAFIMVILGIGELVGAAIGASLGGLIGLSLGWVAAIAIEVVVFAPRVWRTYRGHIAIGDATPAVTGDEESHHSDAAEGDR